MNVVKPDSAWGAVLAGCSPRLVKFVQGLTSERLRNLSSFMLADGTCLRIDANPIRSFADQVKIYKVGRSCDTAVVPAKKSVLNTEAAYALDLNSVKKTGVTYTNAFAGQSYHNYGLAVDLIWRKDGNDERTCSKQRFIDTGIVEWAYQCGLGWGGDWAGKRGWGKNGDMAHFEDANYNIPLNFTDTYRYAFTNKDYSYNPAWVRGNDNFKFICQYNGLSYAAELEKIKKEGGTSDGLKPSPIDSGINTVTKTVKSGFVWVVLGILGGWFLFGRNKK